MKTMQKTVRLYNVEMTVKTGKELKLISTALDVVDTSAAMKKAIKAEYEKTHAGARVIDIEFVLSSKSGLYKFPVATIMEYGEKIRDLIEEEEEEEEEE